MLFFVLLETEDNLMKQTINDLIHMLHLILLVILHKSYILHKQAIPHRVPWRLVHISTNNSTQS